MNLAACLVALARMPDPAGAHDLPSAIFLQAKQSLMGSI